MDDEELVGLARECMRRSYSPYSGYRVGAALLCRDGSVVTACNVENVSYGLTMCAERVAVARAVSEGQRDFVAIAITSDGSEAVTPCGACRQVLAEFALDLRVVSQGTGRRRTRILRELLPEPFLVRLSDCGKNDDEVL
jgi:cytidine deaminase